MEAIILSLLLFFSNSAYSLGEITPDQTNQDHTTVNTQQPQSTDDPSTGYVSSDAGGKIKVVDLEGL